jgi:hypothetical protein
MDWDSIAEMPVESLVRTDDELEMMKASVMAVRLN